MIHTPEMQDQRRQALKEGKAKGRAENLIDNIKALMKAMSWSAQQAMKALNVPPDEQKRLITLL